MTINQLSPVMGLVAQSANEKVPESGFKEALKDAENTKESTKPTEANQVAEVQPEEKLDQSVSQAESASLPENSIGDKPTQAVTALAVPQTVNHIAPGPAVPIPAPTLVPEVASSQVLPEGEIQLLEGNIQLPVDESEQATLTSIDVTKPLVAKNSEVPAGTEPAPVEEIPSSEIPELEPQTGAVTFRPKAEATKETSEQASTEEVVDQAGTQNNQVVQNLRANDSETEEPTGHCGNTDFFPGDGGDEQENLSHDENPSDQQPAFSSHDKSKLDLPMADRPKSEKSFNLDSLAKQTLREMATKLENSFVKQAMGVVELALETKDFGDISARINVNGKKIETELRATEQAVRHAFMNNVKDLIQNVEQRGMHLDGFHVGHQASNQSGQQPTHEQALNQAKQNFARQVENVGNAIAKAVARPLQGNNRLINLEA